MKVSQMSKISKKSLMPDNTLHQTLEKVNRSVWGDNNDDDDENTPVMEYKSSKHREFNVNVNVNVNIDADVKVNANVNVDVDTRLRRGLQSTHSIASFDQDQGMDDRIDEAEYVQDFELVLNNDHFNNSNLASSGSSGSSGSTSSSSSDPHQPSQNDNEIDALHMTFSIQNVSPIPDRFRSRPMMHSRRILPSTPHSRYSLSRLKPTARRDPARPTHGNAAIADEIHMKASASKVSVVFNTTIKSSLSADADADRGAVEAEDAINDGDNKMEAEMALQQEVINHDKSPLDLSVWHPNWSRACDAVYAYLRHHSIQDKLVHAEVTCFLLAYATYYSGFDTASLDLLLRKCVYRLPMYVVLASTGMQKPLRRLLLGVPVLQPCAYKLWMFVQTTCIPKLLPALLQQIQEHDAMQSPASASTSASASSSSSSSSSSPSQTKQDVNSISSSVASSNDGNTNVTNANSAHTNESVFSRATNYFTSFFVSSAPDTSSTKNTSTFTAASSSSSSSSSTTTSSASSSTSSRSSISVAAGASSGNVPSVNAVVGNQNGTAASAPVRASHVGVRDQVDSIRSTQSIVEKGHETNHDEYHIDNDKDNDNDDDDTRLLMDTDLVQFARGFLHDRD
jgi:hypothetical protein